MDQAFQMHAISLGCLQSWDTNLHPMKIRMAKMISPDYKLIKSVSCFTWMVTKTY